MQPAWGHSPGGAVCRNVTPTSSVSDWPGQLPRKSVCHRKEAFLRRDSCPNNSPLKGLSMSRQATLGVSAYPSIPSRGNEISTLNEEQVWGSGGSGSEGQPKPAKAGHGCKFFPLD